MAEPLREVPDDDQPDTADAGPEVSPAQAAAAEAAGDDLVVTFRGEKFTVHRAVFDSARYILALAGGREDLAIHQLLSGDPANYNRFLDLVRPGDNFLAVSLEFSQALVRAGQGNSKSSRRSSRTPSSTKRSKRT
jgi:hypothetical protein